MVKVWWKRVSGGPCFFSWVSPVYQQRDNVRFMQNSEFD